MKEELVLVHWDQGDMGTTEEGDKNDLWLFNFTTRVTHSLNDRGVWIKHSTLNAWDKPESIKLAFPRSEIIDRWVQES